MKIQIQNNTKFKQFKKKFLGVQKEAVKKSGQFVRDEARKNASHSPLSRGQLKNAPYKKGGSGIGGRPWWTVAQVSGAFLKSIRGYLRVTKSGPRYTVDYGNKPVDHVRFVAQGTKIMFARDVVGQTYKQAHVKKISNSILVKELRKGL